MEDTSNLKTLGERIVYLRDQKRWSQGELADAVRRVNPQLKCRQSTIHSIESGQVRRPTILFELARALGTTEQFLMTGVGSARASVPPPFLQRPPQRPAPRTNTSTDNLAARLRDADVQLQMEHNINETKELDKYLAAFHGALLMLNLTEDQANALIDIVCEVVEEPAIPESQSGNYENLKMLSASLTRRFLRSGQG